ncbi:hypothetical protein [Mammaliicoccus sciuri]|uniref:hypothetical protein n=1 Tax=Mammaliicoccus sciuri TaxID=1296 RepID=UPI0021D0D8B7|nr:hypothetical protein [Mammaliicoccus sciuri]UXV31681.1 hypothetical protein MUA60_12140 [Mammaliicoccus sciuri]UXV31869.1 hypothetical protein MUA60_13140 [Mammaliicoccus sciuri]
MTNEKVSRPEKFKLENRDERITKNLDKLPKASGLDFQKHSIGNISSNEVIDVSEFISRKEFEQFEKRIDDKFDNLNNKLDELPERIEDKIKFQISEMKNTQMKWFIGTLIAILGVAGKVFGLY